MKTMSRAEKAARKAYPVKIINGGSTLGSKYDANMIPRYYFINGYQQAKENIISLIESRIGEILGDAQPAPVLREELRELIDKIKEK